MKVYLREDIKADALIPKSRDCIALDLLKGRFLDTIEFANLPAHVVSQLNKWVSDDIKNHAIFVIYLKRMYWLIQASQVDKVK